MKKVHRFEVDRTRRQTVQPHEPPGAENDGRRRKRRKRKYRGIWYDDIVTNSA